MKKTLILSAYAPPSNSGSGLMMFNLLKYFPPDSYVILNSEVNPDPALKKYKLPVNYYYYGNKFLAMDFSGKEEYFLQKLKRKIKNFPPAKFFAQFFVLFALPYKIIKTGLDVIKKEQVQNIVAYSDFGPVLFAAYILHKRTKTPLCLYFYDMYRENKMPFAFKILSNWLEPRLFKSASEIFVMCDSLKEHYENRYQRPVNILYNSIPFDEKQNIPSNIPKSKTEKFKIVFLGTIYWAQEGAVKNLIKAVESIKDAPVELVLYTPNAANYLKSIGITESKNISFSYCLPEEVPNVLQNADLLFVGLSFNSEFPKLINTSSPGKLGEYLISGRPILVHAPKESFLSSYARKKDFAYVVDQDSVEALKNTILSAVSNHSLSQKYAVNAFKIAVENHNAKNTANKFISILEHV